jgi:hypothetical protein
MASRAGFDDTLRQHGGKHRYHQLVVAKEIL